MVVQICIFIIVLFVYVHISYNLKSGNELYVYEITNPTKEKLEEIVSLRQPVKFEFPCDCSQMTWKSLISEYGSFDVNIISNKKRDNDVETISCQVPLGGGNCCTKDQLKDTEGEKGEMGEAEVGGEQFEPNQLPLLVDNQQFLEETGVVDIFRRDDDLFRPHLSFKCEYDLVGIYPTINSPDNETPITTPMKYSLYSRRYLMCCLDCSNGQPAITIRLSPSKYSKYMHSTKSPNSLEFISPINPWTPQSEYERDWGRIKTLDVTLAPGQIVCIPAFWWYSVAFNNPNATIASFSYETVTSSITTAPYKLRDAISGA